jgi:uncharacterized protein with PIN domain
MQKTIIEFPKELICLKCNSALEQITESDGYEDNGFETTEPFTVSLICTKCYENHTATWSLTELELD